MMKESTANATAAEDVKVTTKRNPPSMVHRKIKTERNNDNSEQFYWNDDDDNDKVPQKSCLCPSKWICPMIIIVIYVFGMVRIVGAFRQYIGWS
jgi:hypothetical protein